MKEVYQAYFAQELKEAKFPCHYSLFTKVKAVTDEVFTTYPFANKSLASRILGCIPYAKH
jgi:hypothetical protein